MEQYRVVRIHSIKLEARRKTDYERASINSCMIILLYYNNHSLFALLSFSLFFILHFG